MVGVFNHAPDGDAHEAITSIRLANSIVIPRDFLRKRAWFGIVEGKYVPSVRVVPSLRRLQSAQAVTVINNLRYLKDRLHWPPNAYAAAVVLMASNGKTTLKALAESYERVGDREFFYADLEMLMELMKRGFPEGSLPSVTPGSRSPTLSSSDDDVCDEVRVRV